MFIRWVTSTFFVNKSFSFSKDLNTYMDNLSDDTGEKKMKVKDIMERTMWNVVSL